MPASGIQYANDFVVRVDIWLRTVLLADHTHGDFHYRYRPGLAPGNRGYRSGLTKIEHWHQGSISSFKIMCRDGKGFWHGGHWEGQQNGGGFRSGGN
jgi:hypothetical protein